MGGRTGVGGGGGRGTGGRGHVLGVWRGAAERRNQDAGAVTRTCTEVSRRHCLISSLLIVYSFDHLLPPCLSFPLSLLFSLLSLLLLVFFLPSQLSLIRGTVDGRKGWVLSQLSLIRGTVDGRKGWVPCRMDFLCSC